MFRRFRIKLAVASLSADSLKRTYNTKDGISMKKSPCGAEGEEKARYTAGA